MKPTNWMNIQTGLVEEVFERFNSKIQNHEDDGHTDTYEQGKHFEKEMANIIKKYFSEKKILVDASKGYLIDKYSKKRQINLILKRYDGKEVAFIEVASFGDKPSYFNFKNKLEECSILNGGFFIAICGTAKLNLDKGENRELEPKVYFLAQSKGGSVKSRIRMKKPEIYSNVLEHFLNDLEDITKSKE